MWLNNLLIIFFLIIIVIFIIYIARKQNQYDKLLESKSDLTNTNETKLNEIAKLKAINKKLLAIKFADENIFKFIRCINIPQTPVCVATGTGGSVCRSKLIDCNNFKLVLFNDPVAVERMKMATDKYYQTGKPHNLSDLTYDVKNVSWFF